MIWSQRTPDNTIHVHQQKTAAAFSFLFTPTRWKALAAAQRKMCRLTTAFGKPFTADEF